MRTDATGRIKAIGKGLAGHNALDTGIFLASKALIEAIAADRAPGPARKLSSTGVQRLADHDCAFAFDITDRFWLDIDDAVAHGEAERLSA